MVTTSARLLLATLLWRFPLMNLLWKMGDAHGSERTHTSTLEDHLEELKRLLEENTCAFEGPKIRPDGDQRDRLAELAKDTAAMQQKVQALTALNTELRRQKQGVPETEQKDLMKILEESHKHRAQQITLFLEDMKEAERRSHAELLAGLSSRNK